MSHFVSKGCSGKVCHICLSTATHKVKEQVFEDDPEPNRQGYSSYVCSHHFAALMGADIICRPDSTTSCVAPPYSRNRADPPR